MAQGGMKNEGAQQSERQFMYKYGDKPLPGYTIERGAGWGGFGEVYYAVSDGGRQVALKAIQHHAKIELRGITQCMNLKSPHLVTIFDIKHNEQGKPFVIMEYVSGPSLDKLLAQCPSGLGEQKSAFFLREIAKGLTYLHDCGIVHRDLKPSNIFYENGYVKIGDYGLSKAIASSPQGSQTITVGTVHYMAPEIGQGHYDRSIDIYALGVVLYEMLTGQVPFFGSSAGEILIKHMSAKPDLSGISEPFANVIRKALEKDPDNRYSSVGELVEDVFGSEHVRNSVSHFSPESLSQVAQRAARHVKDTPEQNVAGSDEPKAAREKSGSWEDNLEQQIDGFGEKIDTWVNKAISSTFGGHSGDTAKGDKDARNAAKKGLKESIKRKTGAASRSAKAHRKAVQNAWRRGELGSKVHDTLHWRQRRFLALVALVGVSVTAGLVSQRSSVDARAMMWQVALMVFGSSIGALVAWRWVGVTKLEAGSLRRLIMAMAMCICAGLLSSLFKPALVLGNMRATMLVLVIAFVLVDWADAMSPVREQRLSLSDVIGVGFLGWIGALIFHGNVVVIISTLAGTSLVLQIISAYDHELLRRGLEGVAGGVGTLGNGKNTWRGRHDRAVPPPLCDKNRFWTRYGRDKWHNSVGSTTMAVPIWARMLWLLLFVLSLGIALTAFVVLGVEDLHDEEEVVAITIGIAGLVAAWLFCLPRTFSKRFKGWYHHLLKPLLLMLFLAACIGGATALGCCHLRSEDTIVAAGFLIFGALLFLVVLCVPARMVDGMLGRATGSEKTAIPPTIRATHMVSPHRRMTALLLSLGGFVGICGLQRFYVGKIGTGLLWLLTGGIFGVGQLIDMVMICCGSFKDAYGFPLVMWSDVSELDKPNYPHNIAADVAVAGNGNKAVDNNGNDEGYEGQESMQNGVVGNGDNFVGPPTHSSVMWQSSASELSIFSVVGVLLLVSAFLVGLVVAVHIPAMMAGGAFGGEVVSDMNELFGYDAWPGLLERMCYVVSVVLFATAAVCMIIARRGGGGAHMIRVILGLLGLMLVLSILAESMPHYQPEVLSMLKNNQLGLALEWLFSKTNEDICFGLPVFIVATLLLAWPPKRRITTGRIESQEVLS